jgi:hypothetical protein
MSAKPFLIALRITCTHKNEMSTTDFQGGLPGRLSIALRDLCDIYRRRTIAEMRWAIFEDCNPFLMKPQASNLTLYPIITRELKFLCHRWWTWINIIPRDSNSPSGEWNAKRWKSNNVEGKEKKKGKHRWHAQVPLVRRTTAPAPHSWLKLYTHKVYTWKKDWAFC